MNCSASARDAVPYLSLITLFEAAIAAAVGSEFSSFVLECACARLEDGNALIDFTLYGLPNELGLSGVGEVRFRAAPRPTNAGSEASALISVIPIESAFAVLVGDSGIEYGSGSRNGFLRGRAYLFEELVEAEEWAARSGVECAKRVMPDVIRSLVEILQQLPPWDAARLLAEAFDQIEDPEQRAHLTAIRKDMTKASGAALACV